MIATAAADAKRFSSEIEKISFQFAYWFLVALIVVVLIKLNVIGKNSDIPEYFQSYVLDHLNIKLYLLEAVVLIVLAGLAALSGSFKFVGLAREELARLCYTIGSFAGCVMFAAAFLSSTWANFGFGLFVLLGYKALGFGIATKLKPITK